MNLKHFISLWKFITTSRKMQLIALLLLSMFSVVAEMVSLGSVIPFLAVMIDYNLVLKHEDAQVLLIFFDVNSPEKVRLVVAIIFIFLTIVASIIKLSFFYLTTSVTFKIGIDLSRKVLKNVIYQPYEIQISSSSSEVISVITRKIEIIVGHVLIPILTLISSVLVIIGLTIVMLYVDAKLATILFLSLGFIYVSVSYYVKKSLNKNSECISVNDTKVIKTLQESFGSVRDVIINNKQKYFLNKFTNSQKLLKNAQAQNYFIGNSPRYIVEALGMTLIAWISYTMTNNVEYTNIIIPTIGVLALGLQRLLPLAQSIYSSIANLSGSYSSFSEVIGFLQQDSQIRRSECLLPFENEIILKKLGFKYLTGGGGNSWIFRDVDIHIKKGACVGIVGPTGSGKSTFIDILMGLIHVSEGSLIVDKTIITPENSQCWQKNIAHIPQSVYLVDGDIVANIAFGVDIEQVDLERVRKAAYQANILELIESWPDKYHTKIGENGVFLSGGQKQRISIARALYNEFCIIVLDEATSALDSKTEKEIIKNIGELSDTTVIIISHRPETLKKCDLVLNIEKGRVRVLTG
jgi:ATP-binding cassette, subfamily B, bacterial PglK